MVYLFSILYNLFDDACEFFPQWHYDCIENDLQTKTREKCNKGWESQLRTYGKSKIRLL